MNGSQDLFHYALTIWEWEPSILMGLAIWELGYLWITRSNQKKERWQPVPMGRKIAFATGTLVAFAALVSPLDYISDHYLFSAHMIQHLLLIMVAPPLWLIGLPDGFLDGLPLPGWVQAAIRWVTQPLVAYLVFNAVLLIWHVPSLYEATLENNNLHILEHLLFMAAAMIGWWPVLGRSWKVAPQAPLPLQVLYMFLMLFPSTLLGFVLTFARTPLISFYARAPRLWELAASPGQTVTTFGTMAGGWGLSVMDDQQIAGLVMWIPGGFINLLFLFHSLYAWFQDMEKSPVR